MQLLVFILLDQEEKKHSAPQSTLLRTVQLQVDFFQLNTSQARKPY